MTKLATPSKSQTASSWDSKNTPSPSKCAPAAVTQSANHTPDNVPSDWLSRAGQAGSAKARASP